MPLAFWHIGSNARGINHHIKLIIKQIRKSKMSASQQTYFYNVHVSKMRAQKLTPLTYPRFIEILADLGL